MACTNNNRIVYAHTMTLPAHLRKSGPGTAGRHVKRDKAICARRAEGIALDKIGIEFGLSRERVRQIVEYEKRRAARYNRLSSLRAAFANTR